MSLMDEKERVEEMRDPGNAEVSAEQGPERDEVLERVLASREQHRERSMFVRIGVVVAGGAVSLFAALLSIITPEFGLPLLLFGLRLLALEFDWAARLYSRVEKLARKVAGRLKRMWAKSKVGVILGAVAIIAVAVAAGILLS